MASDGISFAWKIIKRLTCNLVFHFNLNKPVGKTCHFLCHAQPNENTNKWEHFKWKLKLQWYILDDRRAAFTTFLFSNFECYVWVEQMQVLVGILYLCPFSYNLPFQMQLYVLGRFIFHVFPGYLSFVLPSRLLLFPLFYLHCNSCNLIHLNDIPKV